MPYKYGGSQRSNDTQRPSGGSESRSEERRTEPQRRRGWLPYEVYKDVKRQQRELLEDAKEQHGETQRRRKGGW